MSTAVVDYTREEPVVAGRPTASEIDAVVSAPLDRIPSRPWWIAMGVTSTMLAIVLCVLRAQFLVRPRCLGVNQPVSWGFDIVNFVFWVGIGHAGTLISAILFLLRQRWRGSRGSPKR